MDDKPLVLIAANYSEARDYLKRNADRPERKAHIVTPATGQGAAYKAKVSDLTEYLVDTGWTK